MSKFQIFTFSDFQTPSDYSALSNSILNQASEDLGLKESKKSSIPGQNGGWIQYTVDENW